MAENLLLQAGVAFTALAVAGAVARRFGWSVIPAYIVVGVLVGPHGPTVGRISLALVEQREFVGFLAEVGVVLLLFFLGLEIRLGTLVANRSRVGVAAGLDAAVNFPLGLLLGLAFGFSPVESLFLAGIVYISSSAVITKSLIDIGWIADPESEAILGVLVAEDILIAVYLAFIAALAGGQSGGPGVVRSVATALGFLVLLAVVATYTAPTLERTFETRSDELFAIGAVGLTVLVAGVALVAGLSEAVAAFVVGTAFGRTTHLDRVERLVSPARDLFAAVFFLAIGLQTDPRVLVTVAGPLVALVVASTLGKLASGYVGGRTYGLTHQRSVRAGCGLVARGEFSLVIAAVAAGVAATPTLAETIPALTVGYVLVMSFLGPTLMRFADRLADLTAGSGSAPPAEA